MSLLFTLVNVTFCPIAEFNKERRKIIVFNLQWLLEAFKVALTQQDKGKCLLVVFYRKGRQKVSAPELEPPLSFRFLFCSLVSILKTCLIFLSWTTLFPIILQLFSGPMHFVNHWGRSDLSVVSFCCILKSFLVLLRFTNGVQHWLVFAVLSQKVSCQER